MHWVMFPILLGLVLLKLLWINIGVHSLIFISGCKSFRIKENSSSMEFQMSYLSFLAV